MSKEQDIKAAQDEYKAAIEAAELLAPKPAPEPEREKTPYEKAIEAAVNTYTAKMKELTKEVK